jgi:CubicO group peptidase (beta-lactamase class C family)
MFCAPFRYLFLLALLCVVAPAAAQERSLNDTLEPLRIKYGLPALAGAVAVKGRIVAAGAVGTRVHDRKIPVTLDDRFHLGSDTKAMTATIAGMLVDEGKLRWDSTVGEILGSDIPGLHPKFAAIRLEQLLSHSSGIPTDTKEMIDLYISGDNYDYNLSDYRKRIIGIVGKSEPVVPQGSPFQYSNFGYITAGAMIEKVTGQPWEILIRERIFNPLKLSSAGLGPQATMGKIDAPIGHDVTDGKISPRFWGPAADGPPVMGPAGIAHMSIRDFARWAAWNAGEGKRGPALVKPDTLKFIHASKVKTPVLENPKPGTPKTGEYAFGWGVVTFPWTGHPILTHNGSNSMNLAIVFVDPIEDIAIVGTTNFPGGKADAALLELVKTLYEQRKKPQPPR